MQPQITILMATRNGERYLPAQLESILSQSHRNWRLIVSDDGSTDATTSIVRNYAATRPSGRIELVAGPERGATANFLWLIRQADASGWVAFSDQDDIWNPDKLARAVDWLARQDGPAVYAARTTICDENMNELAPAPHFPGPFGFRNALVQACLPGNTTVVNAAALRILQSGAAAADAAGVISHDWWVYQLLSGAGARIRRDDAQVVRYRQHGNNVMGRNDTPRARAARFSMLFDGSYAGWIARNQVALEDARDLLLPENRRLLEGFGRLIEASGPRAVAQALRMRLYRQSRTGTIAIMAAALAGRLRLPDHERGVA
ncbi:glycosyltransferase family 2 protein [Paracoccus sp. MBLB3053]|uniref:Glycosyltransferase family 2 protein n=1 Tax=Paracoccus aurantius TaxID=3073814 RepID=A0ABU2HP25_9RHOB|nr:glycosyltransferase family 2 protein [Paracoccus sp. MBLB3053]MDS9466320.1 glycosyltransferase family 2 protein [Paracoccus sp. MBLB3053]